MKDKSNVNVMLYGRARRINLARKIGIIVGIVIILVIVIASLVKKQSEEQYLNKNYNMLRSYFNKKGYICEMIEKDGGSCRSKMSDANTQETASMQYVFTRYDEGFNYLVTANNYTIQIRHIVNTYNDIILTTHSAALGNDSNKTFICKTDDSIVGNLISCETNSGTPVINEVYIGAVEMAIDDVNEIINASGYNREKLLKDYIWEIQKK